MKPLDDPRVPGLAAAVDRDAFLERLQATLPECRDGMEIVDGQIFDVQYTPGKRALVLYRLRLRERARSRSRPQFLSVQALGADEPPPAAPSANRLARYRELPGTMLRTPWLHLSKAGLVLSAFPLDPVLKHLLEAFDPEAVRRELQDLWRERRVRVRRVSARPLGYTPHARAAILYEVLSESRSRGVPETRRLVAKMNAFKPASSLFAPAWALWRAAGSRLHLAPPVGYLPRLNLTLQEHVEGVRLGNLADRADFVGPVRQTARALATIHGLWLPLAITRRPTKEIQSVQRWGKMVAALRPDRASDVERLRDRLSGQLEQRARVVGPVHGDFHLANVLVDEDRVTLIDLDQLAYGDPALDAGRFLAALRVSALRVAGSPAALEPAQDGFLEQYLAQAGEEESRVRLFESACLLTAAATGFRLQRAGWTENADRLLEESERIFSLADATRMAPRGAEPRTSCQPDARLDWARDAQYMQAALDGYVRKLYRADVTDLRVQASDARRRGHRLRYRIEGRRGGQRWSVNLHGVTDSHRGGRRRFERLTLLYATLQGNTQAPRIPRPVAYLAPLRMRVVEPPSGVPFAALVPGPEGPEAAVRVARALRALHRVPVALDEVRALETELCTARTQTRLSDGGLAERVAALWPRLEERAHAAGPHLAPSACRVPLRSILLQEECVALGELDRVALAHPLLDVGDLVGRLLALAIEPGGWNGPCAVADSLREAYLSGNGLRAEELAPFEALGLLREAAARARNDARSELVGSLIARAEALLT